MMMVFGRSEFLKLIRNFLGIDLHFRSQHLFSCSIGILQRDFFLGCCFIQCHWPACAQACGGSYLLQFLVTFGTKFPTYLDWKIIDTTLVGFKMQGCCITSVC